MLQLWPEIPIIYGEITCYSYGSIRSINVGKLYRPHCSPEAWNHVFFKGNHPQMAQDFRLVKYYHLPRI